MLCIFVVNEVVKLINEIYVKKIINKVVKLINDTTQILCYKIHPLFKKKNAKKIATKKEEAIFIV